MLLPTPRFFGVDHVHVVAGNGTIAFHKSRAPASVYILQHKLGRFENRRQSFRLGDSLRRLRPALPQQCLKHLRGSSPKFHTNREGREAKGTFKEAGGNIKEFAHEEKTKVQDVGHCVYEKSVDAKKRIDGNQVTIQKVFVELLKATNSIMVEDALDVGDIITISK